MAHPWSLLRVSGGAGSVLSGILRVNVAVDVACFFP